MEKILLSICIPTYNRSNCLKICLDSIVNQKWFNNNVEIIISDNASTDNTTNTVNRYQEKYNNFHYYRNNENLWFDKNLNNAVTKANWRYCLILWDDDWFFDWSISYLINILKKRSYNYYLSNSKWFDKNLIIPNLNLNLPYKIDSHFNTLKDFIYTLKWDPIRTVSYFWWMSGQIFFKEKWKNCENKHKYIWSQVIHLHILLETMKTEKFMIISKPIIKTRWNNMRWDTFLMNNSLKRTLKTLKCFKWIALEYDIKYSKINTYSRFFINYLKNNTIYFIKTYIIKDQKLINKLKAFFNLI